MASDTLYEEIRDLFLALSRPEIAQHSQRFFKTAEGEYGYGDKFLGIRMPIIRKNVSHYRSAPLETTQQLLSSEYHEIRLFALLLLVDKFNKGSDGKKQIIYKLYLANTHYINSWDLVDSSSPHIVGAHLLNRDRSSLIELAQSASLWERRIAIISTYHFIKNNQFQDTLNIADQLLFDPEDLIHKAVGWMLREVGNRELTTEIDFLNPRYQNMPRTMLRYAIEKFPETDRKRYLAGEV